MPRGKESEVQAAPDGARSHNTKGGKEKAALKDSEGGPPSEERKEACSICLDSVSTDVVGVLKCTHEFCYDCIASWSERENTCPLCKVRFTSIQKIEASATLKSKKGKGKAPVGKKVPVKRRDQAQGTAMEEGMLLEGFMNAFVHQILMGGGGADFDSDSDFGDGEEFDEGDHPFQAFHGFPFLFHAPAGGRRVAEGGEVVDLTSSAAGAPRRNSNEVGASRANPLVLDDDDTPSPAAGGASANPAPASDRNTRQRAREAQPGRMAASQGTAGRGEEGGSSGPRSSSAVPRHMSASPFLQGLHNAFLPLIQGGRAPAGFYFVNEIGPIAMNVRRGGPGGQAPPAANAAPSPPPPPAGAPSRPPAGATSRAGRPQQPPSDPPEGERPRKRSRRNE